MIMRVEVREDIMALVTPRANIERRHLTKADLFRLRQVIGTHLMAGVTDRGDFILYSGDSSTWRKLVNILPMLTDFREQRIDPVLTRVELLEIVNRDIPLFA